MILVDSSVWIEAWRGLDTKVVACLRELVESTSAVVNPIIRLELLQGARDRRHQQTLRDLLSPIQTEPFPERLWDETAHFYLTAREGGITLTTVDAIIATHARLLHYRLWSLDQVFSKIPGVELFR